MSKEAPTHPPTRPEGTLVSDTIALPSLSINDPAAPDNSPSSFAAPNGHASSTPGLAADPAAAASTHAATQINVNTAHSTGQRPQPSKAPASKPAPPPGRMDAAQAWQSAYATAVQSKPNQKQRHVTIHAAPSHAPTQVVPEAHHLLDQGLPTHSEHWEYGSSAQSNSFWRPSFSRHRSQRLLDSPEEDPGPACWGVDAAGEHVNSSTEQTIQPSSEGVGSDLSAQSDAQLTPQASTANEAAAGDQVGVHAAGGAQANCNDEPVPLPSLQITTISNSDNWNSQTDAAGQLFTSPRSRWASAKPGARFAEVVEEADSRSGPKQYKAQYKSLMGGLAARKGRNTSDVGALGTASHLTAPSRYTRGYSVPLQSDTTCPPLSPAEPFNPLASELRDGETTAHTVRQTAAASLMRNEELQRSSAGYRSLVGPGAAERSSAINQTAMSTHWFSRSTKRLASQVMDSGAGAGAVQLGQQQQQEAAAGAGQPSSVRLQESGQVDLSDHSSQASEFMEKVFGSAYVQDSEDEDEHEHDLEQQASSRAAPSSGLMRSSAHRSERSTPGVSSEWCVPNRAWCCLPMKRPFHTGSVTPDCPPIGHPAPGPDGLQRTKAIKKRKGVAEAVPQAWWHPYCKLREWSELIICCVICCRCISAPMLVGFQTLPPKVHWLLLELLGDALLLADCAASLLTGYDDGGLIVMSLPISARHYAKGWMAVDVVSSLPYAAIPFVALGAAESVQYLVRLPQLMVLLGLARVQRYTSKWQDTWRWDMSLVRIIKLILLSMLVAHLYACLSFYMQRQQQFPDDGWAMQAGLGSEPDIVFQFIYTLLRATSVVMGGNIDLNGMSSSVEVGFTLLAFVAGVLVYAITVGVMSSIVLSLDSSRSAFSERLQMWKDFCRHRQLPAKLRSRVMAQLSVKYNKKRVLDEARLLLDLPAALRADVQCHLCAELVSCVPILQEAAPIVVRALVTRLVREALNPGDAVFRAGDIADCMYFTLKGRVRIVDASGNTLTLLSRGSHFGEMGLLAYLDGEVGVRTADAHATGNTPVELYKLRCADFEVLARYYPEVVTFLRDVAVVRKAYNATRAQEPGA